MADTTETTLPQLDLPADGAGVAVLVARDGAVLFSQGYGLADRENQIPATPETHFRIGSVTKQFTAAAILHLAEQGKLALDDPLSRFFPDFPRADRITLRHLLTHTSGLRNYTDRPDFMAAVAQPISPEDFIAWFHNDAPDFAPGEKFAYCNTGYILLGEVVRKVTDLPFDDYLQRAFFAPLGLHDTALYRNAQPPLNDANGYLFRDDMWQPASHWDMSWAGSAGGLYSTVNDLWRWTEALHGGCVLSAESLRVMSTEVTTPPANGLSMRYGMGLFHQPIRWIPAIGHNGGLDGFCSTLMWVPAAKLTVAVLTNTSSSFRKASADTLLPRAATPFLSAEIAAHEPRADASASPQTFRDYLGIYDYGRSGRLEITLEDDRLFAQITDQNKWEIFPSAPDRFFWKVAAAEVWFQRNSSDAVTGATHHQNGTSFHAPRIH